MNATFVDFRYGMVSERLRRRSDLSFYANSASLLENVVPLKTGGVKQREALCSTDADSLQFYKLIPLQVSATENYIIAMTPSQQGAGDGQMKIYKEVRETDHWLLNATGNSLTHPYSASELDTLSYAQNYEMMILAQQAHKPMVIKWTDLRAFTLTAFSLDTKVDLYIDGALSKDKNGADYTYTNFLDSASYYPAGVCFVSNRLCFYNFKKKPYAFRLSKPYKYMNFTPHVDYQLEESTINEKKYLYVLGRLQKTTYSEKGTYSDIDNNTYTDCYKKEETTVSSTGYYMTTVSIVDENSQEKTSYVYTRKYTLSEDSAGNFNLTETDQYVRGVVYYSEKVTKTSQVITDDCAIELEIASDKDETIAWLAPVGEYVYVGTLSSEWIMPAAMNATNVAISKLSSYGSKPDLDCSYGMRGVFHVQGGEQIRAMELASGAMSCKELTYACSDLFSKGIRQISWQRVPEPRLYALTSNRREIMVMCYDSDYGVQGWSRWTFPYDISSLCILDTEYGQSVYAIVYDSTESKYGMFVFKDGVYSDFKGKAYEKAFSTKVVTNNIDDSATFAYNKKNFSIYADTDGTNFSACTINMNDKTKKNPVQCRAIKPTLSEIKAYNSYIDRQGKRIQIEGKSGEPFTLYALILETEVTA